LQILIALVWVHNACDFVSERELLSKLGQNR